jgi:hypothetical protein
MTTKIQTFGGNIGIGIDDPGSYKLNVIGTVVRHLRGIYFS